MAADGTMRDDATTCRSPPNFPPPPQRAVAQARRWRAEGRAVRQELVGKTYDGLPIEPLYPRAKADAGRWPRAAGAPWQVMQRVDHPDPAPANAQALHDLENGATGLMLVCRRRDWRARLRSATDAGRDRRACSTACFSMPAVAIEFELSAATHKARRRIAALVESAASIRRLRSRFGIDPLGALRAQARRPMPGQRFAPAFARLAAELSPSDGFRGPFAAADGRVVHDAGGIGSAGARLRARDRRRLSARAGSGGVALDDARADDLVPARRRRRPVPDHREIPRAAESCGRASRKLRPRAEAGHLAAETAWRMMTRRDPYVNMLRATMATFAAGVGGADAITVLPFTLALGLPDRVRAARRAQHAADPAGGIEPREGGRSRRRRRRRSRTLTDELCAAAWTLFQEIEAAGGASRALAGTDPEQGRGGARRAGEEHRLWPRGADRHQRVSQSERGGAGGSAKSQRILLHLSPSGRGRTTMRSIVVG